MPQPVAQDFVHHFDANTGSRALVPIIADAPHTRSVSRHATFLAQLIATKLDCPATRAKRRAEPDAAISAYQPKPLTVLPRVKVSA